MNNEDALNQARNELFSNIVVPSSENPEAKSNASCSEEKRDEFQTLDTYLDTLFMNDIENFKTFSERKTGFSNIDNDNVRLYPGLYALGGVSGVGKTSFCCQLADNIAAHGVFVLYFSLEMSKFELVSKAITRCRFKHTMAFEFNASQLKSGRVNQNILSETMNAYKTCASHEIIIEGGLGLSVSDVIQYVEKFIAHTGHKPVVFIDYLQALKPESNKTTRDSIDICVRALKMLSIEHGLTIFAISSFNRTNYLNIADFESFKESGNIEYTSDVVLALQLLAMNAQIFDRETKLQQKRKFVQMAKNANPRKIELIRLKNRFGKSNARYFFDYYPASECFIPHEVEEEEADENIQREFETFEAQSETEKVRAKNNRR